jgi:hypothetical protein
MIFLCQCKKFSSAQKIFDQVLLCAYTPPIFSYVKANKYEYRATHITTQITKEKKTDIWQGRFRNILKYLASLMTKAGQLLLQYTPPVADLMLESL